MRITPVTPGTRPELAAIEAGIMAERGRVSPLYQVLLNSPPLAQGWEQLLTAVRNRNSVPALLREMIILRVAVLNRAPYEFEAHVPHALAAGMPSEKIEALREPGAGTQAGMFSPLECHVIALTDAMTRDIEVPDSVFDPLKPFFSEQQRVDLVATVASYNMVSRFLVALRVGH
ncbi:Alkylhydroperoxidase family enzyme, contains CxxC motif [Polaromonas sp. YR568]|uniref:carboxymuconolactone decarboxylase family protein n=1 Tax=Polaromonas sp. YR568 TaxID=1855301 RepID=UPI0008E8A9EA|nr:carboxymuconolactone decarboxylase family protein [Polaromonas sp. YR568]SFU54404.1 Alkylhydroperoxidase family enzyme, contains CxxC motif [Polaromonas sp. YR568]